MALAATALGGALVVCALVVPTLWLVSLAMPRAPDREAEASSPLAMPAPVARAPAATGPRLLPQQKEPGPPPSGAPSVPHVLSQRMRRNLRMAISHQLSVGSEPLRQRLEQCPDPPPRGDRALAANAMLVAWMQAPLDSGEPREGIPTELTKALEAQAAALAPTLFMLDVETLDSQVKVVNATLAMRGAASEAYVTCAEQVLRGQILFVQASVPGERMRIPFDLGGPESAPQFRSHVRRRH